MAGESCKLNEDESEILKPTSSSSSSPCPASPRPPPTSSSPSHFLKSPFQALSASERLGRYEPSSAAAICSARKSEEESPSSPSRCSTNRCLICRKRLGLTSFRCRCGELFCLRHRYSESHDCSFDYKAAEREQTSKGNPLIRAAKIIKI